jgi:hypothetical protein
MFEEVAIVDVSYVLLSAAFFFYRFPCAANNSFAFIVLILEVPSINCAVIVPPENERVQQQFLVHIAVSYCHALRYINPVWANRAKHQKEST